MCLMLIGLFKVITWILNRLQSFLGILKLSPYFRVFWVFWSRLPISEFLGYSEVVFLFSEFSGFSEVVFLFQSFLNILELSSNFRVRILGILNSSSYFRVFWVYWNCLLFSEFSGSWSRLPISEFSGYTEVVFLFLSFLGILGI